VHIVRTDEEIATLLIRVENREASEKCQGASEYTAYIGMTYEDGLIAIVEWLRDAEIPAKDIY